MLKETREYLKNNLKVSDYLIDIYETSIKDVENEFKYYEEIKGYNSLKVLSAFQSERISDSHFTFSSGYGYNDIGRDALDRVYAKIFNTESAIVRPHFVNGTHAITCAIFGNLFPNDTLLAVSGRPYDTLHKLIGNNQNKKTGSLKDYNVNYKEIALVDNDFNFEEIECELKSDSSIKMIHIQRSAGYTYRRSLSIEKIKKVVEFIKSIRNDVIIFVDNCYGEFIEKIEPSDVGVDILAGSLIKNIGGGLATSGGYIAGKHELVERASYRLTVPGIGGECGATFGLMRTMFQGLFFAPHISMEALKGAILSSRILELCGFEVLPKYNDKRTDIIQAVKFNDKYKLIKFIKGIQYGSPIDSFVECEPWDMPGYDDQVIMASGSFIQGASIEFTADAPIREPYIAYMQGGLTLEHVKFGILKALANIKIN